MAAEPINLFACKIDPEGVLALLKGLAPNCRVTPGPGGWSEIVIDGANNCGTLRFRHSHDYYAGPGFKTQIRGMQGYFSRFPTNNLTPRIMRLIEFFRFVLSVDGEPEIDLHSDDARLTYVFAVARHLDAAIFMPSGLRDASGKILYHASLPPNPSAVMPGISKDAPDPTELPKYQGGTAANPPSPAAERVAKRAYCLGLVGFRGMAEREPEPERTDSMRSLIEVAKALHISRELEPDELRLLQTKPGKADAEACQNAEWRTEASALLAWGLGKLDLPAYDEQVNVTDLARVLGLFQVEHAKAFLTGSRLRQVEDIERLSRQLVGIHWRLREQRLRPGPKPFEQASRNMWFGSLPRDGVQFAKGDLAINGTAIAEAPANAVLACELVVQERHKAINWLCGDNPVYAAVDTPT